MKYSSNPFSLKVIKEIKKVYIINKISYSWMKHLKHFFNKYSLIDKYMPHLLWASYADKDKSL